MDFKIDKNVVVWLCIMYLIGIHTASILPIDLVFWHYGNLGCFVSSLVYNPVFILGGRISLLLVVDIVLFNQNIKSPCYWWSISFRFCVPFTLHSHLYM